MFGDKRVEKKKTPIYKCNLNPIFNASFEFDVPWEQIRDCALDVQVMDFDTVGRNELIGKLLLQCKSIYITISTITTLGLGCVRCLCDVRHNFFSPNQPLT